MRLFKIFILLIFFSSYTSYANHIVGGEIEMIHIGAPGEFKYQISLIQLDLMFLFYKIYW